MRSTKNRSLLNVNEDFECKCNAEITLLDSFFLFNGLSTRLNPAVVTYGEFGNLVTIACEHTRHLLTTASALAIESYAFIFG